MQFAPKSEQELKSENLFAEGDYDFEVLEAEETRSKKGNDMIKLKLNVLDRSGNSRWVYDYLLESMGFKLRHFCEGTGLLSKYDQGTLTARDCIGRSGICKLQVEDASGAYPAKNSVADYVVKAAHVQRPAEQPANQGRATQPARATAPAGEFPDQLPNDDYVPF